MFRICNQCLPCLSASLSDYFSVLSLVILFKPPKSFLAGGCLLCSCRGMNVLNSRTMLWVCFLQLCRSCLGAFTFYTAASSGHVGTAVITKRPLLSLAALAAQPFARRGLLCSHVPLARPPPSSLAVARRGRMASFHEPHRPFTGLIIVISS